MGSSSVQAGVSTANVHFQMHTFCRGQQREREMGFGDVSCCDVVALDAQLEALTLWGEIWSPLKSVTHWDTSDSSASCQDHPGVEDPLTWTSASEMVARYLASRVMAMALMPFPSGQLSKMVCTGMLQDREGKEAAGSRGSSGAELSSHLPRHHSTGALWTITQPHRGTKQLCLLWHWGAPGT